MKSILGPHPSPAFPMPGLMGLVVSPKLWHHPPPSQLLAPGLRSLWARWLICRLSADTSYITMGPRKLAEIWKSR
uniref:TIR domain containing adaptor protein n=1 Tax=Rousettus aegyptiacus TaxID=9407 RepID=A0A7J8H7A2_ROUAE|nr:TIR domain containing adaptor protein [Rousettus aegyptiacus]